ncbi:MAG: alpha/beta fold hydrolase [Nocardioides sp.]|uniref:alpha/beta fold hydrolase n=1 Tax=Nocardioides sp. TaxID=35761 RepID=UPI0039E4B64A
MRTEHRIDLDATSTPVGFHRFTSDISIDFQCNRWLQWIGPSGLDEIAELARRAGPTGGYESWIEGFLELADQAAAAGRELPAAYFARGAEFFMANDDPLKPATRRRFVLALQQAYGVRPEDVPFGSGSLPAYDLAPAHARGLPIVVFGGFDSYIEEFFPLFAAFVARGRRVIAFEGPGQGGALEEHGLTLIPEWERPVSAVLDHFGIDQAVAVGISLGGALVIRAAAFEPRIVGAVAFDVCDSEFTAATRTVGPATPVLRALMALHARPLVNGLAALARRRRPLVDWALPQGMHITGTRTAYDFLRTTARVRTAPCSSRITADVLLLAGADDHYIPPGMLARQAATLTAAQSVTTRMFTRLDQASNHCQIGNIGLAGRVIDDWATDVADRRGSRAM